MIVRALFPILSLCVFQVEHAPSASAAPGSCETAARALLVAARAEADAACARAIAGSLSTGSSGLRASFLAALAKRADAFVLAEQQLERRIELCTLFGGTPYAPAIDPRSFSSVVDHPFFPLVPGRTLVYRKVEGEEIEERRVTTLPDVVTIQGVACRAVATVQTVDGEVVESSTSWYAQHADGSVWWFGELSQHFADGLLSSLDGSWRAGLHGAQPGIVVPAPTNLGTPFRRALAVGVVEDVGRVTSRTGSARVPYGAFEEALEIEELDPLEPLELVFEILVHGIGLVLEVEPRTGARLELVAIVDAPTSPRDPAGARPR